MIIDYPVITATGGPVLGLPGLPTTKLERVLGMPALSYKTATGGPDAGNFPRSAPRHARMGRYGIPFKIDVAQV